MSKKILSSILALAFSLASAPYSFPQTNQRLQGRALIVIVTPKTGSDILVDGVKQGEGQILLKDVASGMRRIEAENPKYNFILTRDVLVERGNLITVRIDFPKREVMVRTESFPSQGEATLPPGDPADLSTRKASYEAMRILGKGAFSYSQGGEEFGRFSLEDRIKGVPEALEEYNKHRNGVLLSYLGGIGAFIGLIILSEGAFEFSRKYYPGSDLAKFSGSDSPLPGLKALEIIGGTGIVSLNVWLIIQQAIEAAGHLDLAVEKHNRSLRSELDLKLSDVAY